MPKGKNQKLKLYRLASVLMQQTDNEHGITMQEIIERLNEYGISADRKSIYDDIAALDMLGITVDKYQEGRSHYYYVSAKVFETAELKLLADAIQSSKFITEKKSRALIQKLTGFASRYEALQLNRQVYVSGRIKTMNESIYYNVDAIYNAIGANRQITFEYLKWTIQKKLVPRKSTPYMVSPWALSWENENYYLIAFDDEAKKIKHYRVDKMRRITKTDVLRAGREHFESFDMASYTNKSFGMFGGKEESVRLFFDNSIAGVIIDRFGSDITIYPVDEKHCETIVNVAISDQFFGWVFALGNKIRIESPKAVRGLYKKEIDALSAMYE